MSSMTPREQAALDQALAGTREAFLAFGTAISAMDLAGTAIAQFASELAEAEQREFIRIMASQEPHDSGSPHESS